MTASVTYRNSFIHMLHNFGNLSDWNGLGTFIPKNRTNMTRSWRRFVRIGHNLQAWSQRKNVSGTSVQLHPPRAYASSHVGVVLKVWKFLNRRSSQWAISIWTWCVIIQMEFLTWVNTFHQTHPSQMDCLKMYWSILVVSYTMMENYSSSCVINAIPAYHDRSCLTLLELAVLASHVISHVTVGIFVAVYSWVDPINTTCSSRASCVVTGYEPGCLAFICVYACLCYLCLSEAHQRYNLVSFLSGYPPSTFCPSLVTCHHFHHFPCLSPP